MKIAIDTETFLIRPGLAAPPLVCVSWAVPGESGLEHVDDVYKTLRDTIESDAHIYGLNFAYDAAVIAEQFPDLFEPLVLAYFERRIHDVGLDQRLVDISEGQLDGRWVDNPAYNPELPAKGRNKPLRWIKNKYALAELVKRHFAEYMNKGEDTWRLRYGTLRHTPIAEWPEDAKHYAILDAINTLRVHEFQDQNYDESIFVNSGEQAEAAFGLHLMSCRGIRTDGKSCEQLIAAAEREILRCRDLCALHGLIVREKSKWTKKQQPAREYMLRALLRDAGLPELDVAELQRAIAEFPGEVEKSGHITVELDDVEIKVKLTEGNDVSLDAEACRDTNDPVLRAYATFTSATTLRSKTKRMALGAIIPLQTRFQPLVATGRTSSSKSTSPLVGDNFQNFRRNAMVNELAEELPGQRECIIARDGYVLCSVDYDNAEMRSEGQIALWETGKSVLADALNAGQDVHLRLAASHLLTSPVTYEEAARRLAAKDKEMENARQFAKVPNFALLGGARALTMIPYAKGMKIELTEDRAHELYDAFHSEWTEIAPMHRAIKMRLRDARKAGASGFHYQHHISKRIRFIDRYTVGCNNPFQGLTADAAKSAILWLAVECYTGWEYNAERKRTGRRSVMFGAFPVLFAHDEIIAELVVGREQEQAYRMRDIMVQAYNRYTPDVPMSAEPALMSRWYKGAEKVLNSKGELIAWEPKIKLAA